MSFSELNLHPELLVTLQDLGFEQPTPIQLQAIPTIMQGFDLKASAQTGTGKTAAYLLPVLDRLAKSKTQRPKGPRVLILVPTRELAMQVATQAEKLTKRMPQLKTVCIYGGAPYPIQNRQLSRHYDILVATPGRLIDHLNRGRIVFDSLEALILDEADRMLDMGFIEPVVEITNATPATKQTLLFSATMKGSVVKLADKLLKEPRTIDVAPVIEKNDNIEQRLFYTDNLDHKNQLLNHFLLDPEVNQAIVFTSTKRHADLLVDELSDRGIKSAALHGDMNQRQRTRTLSRIRKGDVKILVATDVAARGIDVHSITHVINFDLPFGVEDYVHRIGRTGRAGASGIALSLASQKDAQLVKRIEEYTGKKIAIHTVAGMEPKLKPKPKQKPRPMQFRRQPGNKKPFRSGR